MKLYHGTSESRARRALIEGLRPRGEREGEDTDRWNGCPSSGDHVYLTVAYAPYFAAAASGEDERWAIIEIDTDLLPDGMDALVPDEDFLEQATRNETPPKEWGLPTEGMEARTEWFRDRLHWFAHLWEQSVDNLGNCAHEGSIPPEAITRVVFVDPARPENKAAVFMACDPSISILNYRFTGSKYRALTRWFMGDALTDSDWIALVGIPEIALTNESFRAAMTPQINSIKTTMADQSALEAA